MSIFHGGARKGAGRPKTDNPKRRLSIRLNNHIYTQLEEISKDNEQTMTEVIENAIWLYLDINRQVEASKQ